jgi:hypothetical protein
MGKVDESFSPNRMHLERNKRAEDAECTIFVAVGVEKCGGLLTFRWLALLISVFEFSRTTNKEERGPPAGGTFCRSARRALEACEAMLSTARSLPVFARDLHDRPYASKRPSHRKDIEYDGAKRSYKSYGKPHCGGGSLTPPLAFLFISVVRTQSHDDRRSPTSLRSVEVPIDPFCGVLF